jgi:capsular polysaccharide biosynthesis protein
VIVLVTAVVTGAAVMFSLLQTPTYTASTKMLVGQKQNAPDNSLSSEVQGLQQLTQTMVEGIPTQPVAEDTIQRLDLGISADDFLKNLKAKQIGNTQFIEISYEDPGPEKAQQIADTVAEVFSERISKVSPSANSTTATVWEEAAKPDFPSSPKPLRNGALALVVGGILGVGLAFLLEYLDDRWRSPEEVEQVSGVPTFGAIPEFKAPKVSKSKKKGGD